MDYLIGSGPMLLGHGHPEVMEAVLEQLPKGMTFFANNAKGIELAEAIVEAVPCCEQVRFVASGGEADMYAIRLARAYTGKSKILKFEGGYHGMSAEAQMSLAPSKQVNFPTAVPDSAGIPQGVADEMLIAPFNDLEAVASLLGEHKDVAAIIAEPLQRIIPAQPGGPARSVRQIMAHFDKAAVGVEKWLMQLGTLSGNPVATTAGLKTMEILRRPGQYERLRELGQTLMDMQSKALTEQGIAHRICGDPTLFDIYFTDVDPVDDRSAKHSDPKINEVWNSTLRAHGVFKSPGKLYPSLALVNDDLELTRSAFKHAAHGLPENGMAPKRFEHA